MKTKRISIIVLMFLITPLVFAQSRNNIRRVGNNPRLPQINLRPISVRAVHNLRNARQAVKVRGFYYDGTVPMLLDNFNLVKRNTLLPKNSFVRLAAPLSGVKNGEKVEVITQVKFSRMRGNLRVPSLKKPAPRNVTRVTQISRADLWRKIPDFVLVGLGNCIIRKANKHAILISGGYDATNNHARYWNDLAKTYEVLVTKKCYREENIHVLYADGTPRVANSMPVDGGATKAEIKDLFNDLKASLTSNDEVLIMTNNHGGGFHLQNKSIEGGVVDTNGDEQDNYSESSLNMDLNGDGDKNDIVSFDEVLYLWQSKITDDDFAKEIDKLSHIKSISIVMEQCFSGGFIDDLMKPYSLRLPPVPRAGPRIELGPIGTRRIGAVNSRQLIGNYSKRVLMSAASEEEFSYGGTTYNIFTYWWISALNGSKIDNTSQSLVVDANSDNKISMAEVYEYARSHDTANETPHYDDNSQNPIATGAIPGSNDGSLGSKIYP
ncbi:MAG: caspase family protein [Bacteriovoracaceae bacterium]|nr:caspase family protein [Bacteriovoracaceae bacterium]